MKLVFYGGGFYEYNKRLNERAVLLTKKKNPLITYIPSYSYGAEQDFMEFVYSFDSSKVTKFLYFPVDRRFDKTLLKEVLTSDMIHLSGGDTFYFLKHLKKSGFLVSLKHFVHKGGVLTGLSAGGIIMGPEITPASYPAFDKDDNEEGLKDWSSIGLSKFEFFPHYKNSHRYERELLKQSKKTESPLLGVPDYNGIIIDGDKIEFFGRIYCFHAGKKSVFN